MRQESYLFEVGLGHVPINVKIQGKECIYLALRYMIVSVQQIRQLSINWISEWFHKVAGEESFEKL